VRNSGQQEIQWDMEARIKRFFAVEIFGIQGLSVPARLMDELMIMKEIKSLAEEERMRRRSRQ